MYAVISIGPLNVIFSFHEFGGIKGELHPEMKYHVCCILFGRRNNMEIYERHEISSFAWSSNAGVN